mgnify:CR=1 FL=1
MPRIIITEPGKSPQPYRLKLDRNETRIGRGPENHIILEAGSASTNHCVMKRVDGGYILEDLNSTNGIKSNDIRYRIIDLSDGMIVKIGDDIDIEFTLSDDEINELSNEDSQSHQQAQLPKTPPSPPAVPSPEKDEAFAGIDYEEETPSPLPENNQPDEVADKKSSSNAFVVILLAILALAIGFGIRHYQDIIQAQKTAPATEAPVAPLPANN